MNGGAGPPLGCTRNKQADLPVGLLRGLMLFGCENGVRQLHITRLQLRLLAA